MNRQAAAFAAPPLSFARRAPFVLVSGGKGGVGKSTVAANLGVALARRGRRVLLVDLDLGLANLHVMLGVDPPVTVEDFLDGRRSLAECRIAAAQNLDLVPAANGSHELARPDGARRRRLANAIDELANDYDVVLADASAGLGPDGMAFAVAADLVLAVTTPEPAAITDAYGLVKALDAWAKEHVRDVPTPDLVVNQAASPEEAEAWHQRLAGTCERFLARRPRLAGWLPRAREVDAAIRTQRPVVDAAPQSLVARSIERLADRIQARIPAPAPA